ncbi:hypothetical protein JX188_002460, partial [Enterococcus faecalis]|nr:hypothetical protein [Enterococcus faecalis]
MSIKLLKINVQNLNCFENNQLCFDFYATKKVYQHEVEDNEVCHLFNNIYLLNKIAIIGKNATGKSTTMNIISDIMKIYIDNKSITECKNLSNHFNESLYLECILYNDSHLYKVETKIRKKEMDELFFDEEIIYEKKVNSRTNKENF